MGHRRAIWTLVFCLLGTASWSSAVQGADEPSPVYQTYGVHSPAGKPPCEAADCRYVRKAGEPTDPLYPPYWRSRWTMYRVFGPRYAEFPPPWRDKPPAQLKAGVDYEVSYGVTYYDSTWAGASGQGAMMEHYEKRCLPIFPIDNRFTCSFISLGDVAFFVTYPQDRPAGMPPVCLFSPLNHAPRRNFVSHLPYSNGDSRRLGPGGQAYAFWVGLDSKIQQVGAGPMRSPDDSILFGYAFAPGPDGKVQPSSFYFSGSPYPPRPKPGGPTYFAPVVSQNYTGWKAEQPDPAKTWAEVADLNPTTLPACQLFDPPDSADRALSATQAKRGPTWADIGRGARR